MSEYDPIIGIPIGGYRKEGASMSEDIVNSLRAWADPVESGYKIPAAGRVMREAADTIEALRGEVEAYESARATWAEVMQSWIKRASIAEAEAVAATAENARLKWALEEIVRHEVSREQFIMQGPAFAARMISLVNAIARKALAGETT